MASDRRSLRRTIIYEAFDGDAAHERGMFSLQEAHIRSSHWLFGNIDVFEHFLPWREAAPDLVTRQARVRKRGHGKCSWDFVDEYRYTSYLCCERARKQSHQDIDGMV
jgi:hypothetical protein